MKRPHAQPKVQESPHTGRNTLKQCSLTVVVCCSGVLIEIQRWRARAADLGRITTQLAGEAQNRPVIPTATKLPSAYLLCICLPAIPSSSRFDVMPQRLQHTLEPKVKPRAQAGFMA